MILITGGMGFIGLHAARSLVDIGEKVVISQHRIARSPAFISSDLGKNAFIEKLDATNSESMMEIGKRHRIDGIIHLAMPGLGALDPAADYKVHMDSLLNVMEAARIWQVKRLSIASSVAVYAGLHGPFKEEMPVRMTPTNSIETYKKAFELLATHYAQNTGIDVVLLRIASIWGPMYHSMRNSVSRMVHAAIKGTAPELGGDLYEDDAHDYCYARDCGRAVAMLQSAEKLSHQTYNIGGGRASSNQEFATAIKRHFRDAILPLQKGASQQQTDPYMDLTRIKEDVGYEPRFTVDTAMDDYVAWLSTNPQ